MLQLASHAWAAAALCHSTTPLEAPSSRRRPLSCATQSCPGRLRSCSPGSRLFGRVYDEDDFVEDDQFGFGWDDGGDNADEDGAGGWKGSSSSGLAKPLRLDTSGGELFDASAREEIPIHNIKGMPRTSR